MRQLCLASFVWRSLSLKASLAAALAFLPGFPVGATEAAIPCLALIESYKDQGIEHYAELRDVVTLLESVDTRLLEGRRMPTFNDVAVLEKISELMIKARRFRGDRHRDIFAELKSHLPQANVSLSTGPSPDAAESYKPTDGELKSLYQSVWNRIATELPKEMGLPLIKISYRLQKKAELRQNGRDLIQQLDKNFSELFPSTSGFTSFEAFQRRQEDVSARDSARRALVDMVRSEGIEVVVQRPIGARWWAPKIGLHNQHITGTSQGYKGKLGRNAVEATYLNMSAAAYSEIDDSVKPVYGHIQPAPAFQARIEKTKFASVYGSDGFVLNLDRVRDRLSFTYGGDSLSRAGAFIPAWREGRSSRPISWDHGFIPWAYRETFADALATETLQYASLERQPKSASGLRSHAPLTAAKYIEVQVFGGGIEMSDVAAFEFSESPPEGDFLMSLRQEGVEIRKRDDNKTAIWEPDLKVRELKSQMNDMTSHDAVVDIHSLVLRQVSFEGDVLDPQYEWSVRVVTKEDLGEFTHRLKVVDVNSVDRRVHPTVARVRAEKDLFVYEVRIPQVKIHETAKLYVQLKSSDGRASVYSNEKKPQDFFVFNALE